MTARALQQTFAPSAKTSTPRRAALAASLRALLARQAGDTAEIAQDLLDVLAAAERLKPLAVVGCGYRAPRLLAALAEGAADEGLSTLEGPFWASPLEERGLPAWYRELLAQERSANPVLYVFERPPLEGGHIPPDSLEAEAEAALLGYPGCCVRALRRRRAALHRRLVRSFLRQGEGEIARAAQLAHCGVVPAPRDAGEAAALRRLLGAPPLPYSSIVPCPACRRDPHSPARRQAAAQAALAASLAWPLPRSH